MYKIFDTQFLGAFAIEQQTPCYVYDTKLFQDTLDLAKTMCEKYFANNATIHYALKANDNTDLLAMVWQSGLGVDCVSGGEVEHAINNGFNPSQIVFAGVGKEDWEIELGLRLGIYAFNCESLQEVEVINTLAQKLDKIAKIMFRVNPDIDAKTHKHISTGMYDNKFGVTFKDVCDFIPILKKLHNICCIGLHYHIGSQITQMDVFTQLGEVISTHYEQLYKQGLKLTDVNLGGGLGVNYTNPQQQTIADFENYFKSFQQSLRINPETKIHFELGRSLVAQCGIMLSRVLFTKNTAGTNFAIVDAGMNDLMRPALYEAKHVIKVLKESTTTNKYHVAGPVCESTDIFARDLVLSTLERGDIVAFLTSGAYGRVLANQYNRRQMIKEYLI